jgi:hypothetical protein
MAADPRLTNLTASAGCNAVVDRLDEGAGAGIIEIYNGTIPTDADTALGAQTKLATLTFSDPAFGNASNGTATASAITSDTSADNSGTATWARWLTSGGTVILDCTVGTSGEDINFNTNIFTAGATIAITALTVALPKT